MDVRMVGPERDVAGVTLGWGVFVVHNGCVFARSQKRGATVWAGPILFLLDGSIPAPVVAMSANRGRGANAVEFCVFRSNQPPVLLETGYSKCSKPAT